MAKQSVGVLLTPEAHRRVSRAVHGYENAPVSPAGRRRVDNRAPVVPLVRAKVTTAIPGGTYSVPTSTGRAVLLNPDGTESEDEVVVHNQFNFSTPVAAGKGAFLAWIAGLWWLIQADCP